ncbi:hypothetical protein CK203_012950 [Vitis vinifera]|uniref:Uncharacterized protein n=1 Tax=Vitis vinifera TaxID=29760 RepID=A0A438JLL9_VITVI|nr:hypothetical protein CK203_012950 [Vitis vinifera]
MYCDQRSEGKAVCLNSQWSWCLEKINERNYQTYKRSVLLQDSSEGTKPVMPFRSFDNRNRRPMALAHPAARSKSVLSAFFAKQKTPRI